MTTRPGQPDVDGTPIREDLTLMHPQRDGLPIEPYSPFLDAAADHITTARDRIANAFRDLRDERPRPAVIGAIAGAVGAVAALIAVLFVLGDAIGSGLSWLVGLLTDGATTIWDQMLYPGAIVPITAWFGDHAGTLGFDPNLVLLSWTTVGAVLLLGVSVRNLLGIVTVLLWLGWATATTVIAHAGADSTAAALSAGTTGAALALLTMLALLQLPEVRERGPRNEDTPLRTRMEHQQSLLAAARDAAAPTEDITRLRQQLAKTVSRLAPGSPAADERRMAIYHQHIRESQALPIVVSLGAAVGGLLLLGATGWAGFAVVSVIAVGVTIALVSMADYDEFSAHQTRYGAVDTVAGLGEQVDVLDAGQHR